MHVNVPDDGAKDLAPAEVGGSHLIRKITSQMALLLSKIWRRIN